MAENVPGAPIRFAARAHSSAGERSLHTREVPGSIPGAPTHQTAAYMRFLHLAKVTGRCSRSRGTWPLTVDSYLGSEGEANLDSRPADARTDTHLLAQPPEAMD